MQKLKNWLKNHLGIVGLLLTIPLIWALFVPGFYGASDDIHIAWLYEMDATVKAGQLPPRYVPDLSYGFGYPLFNFVFPLPFYIGEVFHGLGFNFVDSIKLLFLVSLTGSVLAMYWLLKPLVNKWLALAGGIIYGYTPYRSNDVYNRGALGEAFVFLFLPLVLLAIVKIAISSSENKGWNLKWLAIGGLSLGAVILCHDITAYMFMPFVLLLGLILVITTKNRLNLIYQLASLVGLSLVISLYFWLPAVWESQLMKYDTVFNFIDHFPTLKQLLIPYWGYGASVPGPGDGMSFFIGSVNLLLFGFGTLLFVFNYKKFNYLQKSFLIWAEIAFVVAFVMMNYRTALIWQITPMLAYFQFPWRFLIMTTLASPIFVISLSQFKKSWLVGSALIALGVALNGSFFRPHDFLGRTDQYYLNRYVPVPVASSEYKLTNEEYLRLPKQTDSRPAQNYSVVFDTPSLVSTQEVGPFNTFITTSALTSSILNYRRYLFPGWQARIDNQPVSLRPGSPFGQVKLNLPAGAHQIKIYYQEPVWKFVLDLVSLGAVILSVLLSLRVKLRLKKG